ncbi:hypothetical protein OAN27_00750 [Pelagibacteraceae bacterium]|nr:hypothetical protein [Pelagibacteraceae bacterium]
MINKLKTLLGALAFLAMTSSVSAGEFGVGITGAYLNLETEGSEILRDSNESTSAAASEKVTIPEIFIEYTGDSSVTLGFAYIPGEAELGSKSKAKTDSLTAEEATAVTNKAAAEFTNHMTFYAEFHDDSGFFLKGGIVRVNVTTLETLGTGGIYSDVDDVYGYLAGVGFKGDIPLDLAGQSLFYKLGAEYVNYHGITLTGAQDSVTNGQTTIDADIDSVALKLSLGTTF